MPAEPSSQDHRTEKRRAGAEVIAGIESEIVACHRLSAGHRLSEVGFFAALYATGALLVAGFPDALPALLAGILMMGLALNACGILIHEGLHGILARDARINHLGTFLCGLPLLISASAYRATHRDHHFEFGRRRDYGTYRQHLDNRYFIWSAYFAQLFLGSVLYVLLIPVFAWRTASNRTRACIIVEYVLIAAALVSLIRFAPAQAILHYWVFPALVMMALTNVRGLASHALGDLEDIYLSSRTVRASPLVELLFLHENYHLEHHLFPRVPSYRLKRAHRLVWNRLPRALHAHSYTAFLLSFFKASLKLDLSPCGLTYPAFPQRCPNADPKSS